MTVSWTPYKIRQLAEFLTDRDQEILLSIEKFRMLSTRLIQRLHFPAGVLGEHRNVPAATRGTTRVLNRLEAHGLIARLPRRIGGIKHGSAGTVWQLAATGERYLRAQRANADRRRFVTPTTTFMDHTLEIADLAVTLIEQSRLGRFELLAVETEPTCWREHTGASGSVVNLKPDLFVITADSDFESHCFIEIDCATEHLPAVIRKCRTYQQHHQTGVEQIRAGLFPLVVWVTPNETRSERLQRGIDTTPGLDPGLFRITTRADAISVIGPGAVPDHHEGGRNQRHRPRTHL
jgi:hypothetical protein